MLEHRLEKKTPCDKSNQKGREKISESFLIYTEETNSLVKSDTGEQGTKEIFEKIYIVNYENNLFP